MTCHSMFKNYYAKLRQKYRWLITFDMPFQKPVWVNGDIDEIFDYIKDSGSISVFIQNNQCSNPYKEPIEYIYYDTGDWTSRQKVYGIKHKHTIRMDYDTNEIYYCKFDNKYGNFTCSKDIFDDKPSFLLFIGNYEYDVDRKHIFTRVNSPCIKLEKEDYDKIQRFI